MGTETADTPKDLQIKILLEEYRALYGLAVLRLNALDKRVPVTAGTMTAVVASLDVASPNTQQVLLLALPVALIWFARATTNHARSFEDALRRIEEIEHAVNTLASKALLKFQSRHPSRRLEVGGRTGRETVAAVVATALLTLFVAAYRVLKEDLLTGILAPLYLLVLAFVGVVVILEAQKLRQYRYTEKVDISSPGGVISTR